MQNKTKQNNPVNTRTWQSRVKTGVAVEPFSQSFRAWIGLGLVRLPLKIHEYVYGMPEIVQVG